MKKVTLYILTLIIGSFVIACNDESSTDDQSQNEQTVVRIMATVDIPGNKPMVRNSITRAAGEVDDSTSDYEEGTEIGDVYENAIGKVRVMAFNTLTGNIALNTLFRANEIIIMPDNRMQFDLRLWAGSYHFVLFANDFFDEEFPVTNYSELIEMDDPFTNPIENVDALLSAVDTGSGISMIGEALVNVPANLSTTTADNPHIVSPQINLKRTIAKVEVSIKNTDDNGNVIETARAYKLKRVDLQNVNQNYYPFEGNNNVVEYETGDDISNMNLGHTVGDPFNKTVLTTYCAERKNVTEEDVTFVTITAEANGTEYTYKIPLFQYEADGKTKNYDIRRNTIYRIGTVLKGKELSYELNVYTEVEGWVTVTIGVLELPPVDYLHLDTKTIYLGSSLTGNHTENIYYSSNLEYMEFEAGDITGLNVQNHSEFLEITIPKNNFTAGDSKPLKLIYGKGGKRVLNVTIMVKAIDKPLS